MRWEVYMYQIFLIYVSDISHKYGEEVERHTRDEWNELDYKWIMDEFASGSDMI